MSDLSNLTEHDWLQIEQAASGCISGKLGEWPDLQSALIKTGKTGRGCLTMASVVSICRELVLSRQLAATQAENERLRGIIKENQFWLQSICDTGTNIPYFTLRKYLKSLAKSLAAALNPTD